MHLLVLGGPDLGSKSGPFRSVLLGFGQIRFGFVRNNLNIGLF